MEIRKREVYRYLGYRNQEPDEIIKLLTDEVLEELTGSVTPKSVMRQFSCRLEKDRIYLYDGQIEFSLQSKDLSYNLHNCEFVIAFAATLGNAPDLLLRKYEIMNMAKASVVQAASAELIEGYCNEQQEQLKKDWEEKGYYLKPRFSPGYGDLGLETQKMLFEVLSCEKRIGLTLTDTLLMLPTKSVTALIGVTKEASNCHIGKCNNCDKKDCEFRDEY